MMLLWANLSKLWEPLGFGTAFGFACSASGYSAGVELDHQAIAILLYGNILLKTRFDSYYFF